MSLEPPIEQKYAGPPAGVRGGSFVARYPELVIALIGVVIAAAWLPLRMRFPFDDTYITFRYAQNLAHGFGIVWNPGGAHTEGYTNFLYMLLLTPFSAMGCDLIVVAQCVNVVAVIITAIVIYKICSADVLAGIPAMGRRPAGTPALQRVGIMAVALFYLDPFVWMNAYSGMETSLFTMFLLLSIGMLNHDLRPSREGASSRFALPFLFATLATLTRPEGAMMGVILVVAVVFRLRSVAVTFRACPELAEGSRSRSAEGHRELKLTATTFALWFVLPLTIYAVWKYWYFGDLLPNSFYVKVAQSKKMLPGIGSMAIFYEHVLLLAILALLALGQWRRSVTVRVAVLWCVFLTTFYCFSILLMNYYDRFTNSIEVVLIVLAGYGSAYVIERLFSRGQIRGPLWNGPRFGPLRVWACAIMLSLVVGNFLWSLTLRGGSGELQKNVGSYEETYRRIAPIFASIPHQERITLAWGDAGILPYYSGLRSLDPIGLNTTSIAHAGSTKEVVRLIASARPDMIFIPIDLRTHQPITWGHGLIGNAYPMLVHQPELASYRNIASIPLIVYDLNVLVDTLSPHYKDIVNGIVPRIGSDPDFKPPISLR